MNESGSEFVLEIESDLAALRATDRLRRKRRWRAVGLAVVAVYFGAGLVLSPVVARLREESRTSSCNCQLKQIGLAFHNYHSTHGCFPPAITLGPDGSAWHSWRVLILPYLDCDPLYQKYKFDEPWDGPNNKKLLDQMPPIFACQSRPQVAKASLFDSLTCGLLGCDVHPENARGGLTSYAVAIGGNTVFPGVHPTSISDISDGMTNTILVVESTRTRIPWTKPEDIVLEQHPLFGDPDGFSGQHARAPRGNGVMTLFADGRVSFLWADLPQDLVNALFTRNGGELVPNEF